MKIRQRLRAQHFSMGCQKCLLHSLTHLLPSRQSSNGFPLLTLPTHRVAPGTVPLGNRKAQALKTRPRGGAVHDCTPRAMSGLQGDLLDAYIPSIKMVLSFPGGKKHKTQPDHCTHFPSASDLESHARPKTHVLKISPLLNAPRQPRECHLHHTPLPRPLLRLPPSTCLSAHEAAGLNLLLVGS